MTQPPKPLYMTAAHQLRAKMKDPFSEPGTTWRPLHRKPHGNNKRISIRRAIAGEK